MIPSLEGWPTKTKEAPSFHEVRLTWLDTNPVSLCLGEKKDRKVAKKKLQKLQGKSMTCNTIRSASCCMQVVNTNRFISNQTKTFPTYSTILDANGLSTY